MSNKTGLLCYIVQFLPATEFISTPIPSPPPLIQQVSNTFTHTYTKQLIIIAQSVHIKVNTLHWNVVRSPVGSTVLALLVVLGPVEEVDSKLNV